MAVPPVFSSDATEGRSDMKRLLLGVVAFSLATLPGPMIHGCRPTPSGEGYDYAECSATLTVHVPQVCPCCGG